MMLTDRHTPTTPTTTEAPRTGARLGRVAAGSLAVAALLAGTGIPAWAYETYATGFVPLSTDELRSLRGGVMVNGVQFDFGAVIQLRLSGELAAETVLTMNNDGTLSRSTEIFNNTVTEFMDPSQLAGTNIQLNGPNGSAGFIVQDSNGVSLALNNVAAGKLFGLLANGAINRDITQSIDATLTINNFSQINAGLLSDIAAGRAMSAGLPDVMLQ